MGERVLHCWQGRREEIEDRYGFGSEEWAETYREGWRNGTCMLEAGHDGPHEFTDDSKIGVAFAPTTEGQS